MAMATGPPDRVCALLRWKGRHTDDDDDVHRSQFLRNPVQYRCLITGQAWGVDGAPAVPELCRAGRGCHRPTRTTERHRRAAPGGESSDPGGR